VSYNIWSFCRLCTGRNKYGKSKDADEAWICLLGICDLYGIASIVTMSLQMPVRVENMQILEPAQQPTSYTVLQDMCNRA